MRIGMIGLGRMGMNMARRLLKGGYEVVAYNRTKDKVRQLVKEGAIGADSLSELSQALSKPGIAWVMLPAGQAVEDHIEQLSDVLSPEDIILDGGNSHYKDDLRRAETLSSRGINFMDIGVSGGIWGLDKGYCLMAGGRRKIYDYMEPAFRTLAQEDGCLYCGPAGAGHFVKMVHNGIEYGMMQAYGEGFEILKSSRYAESIDFAEMAHLWNHGSVVRSWLLELAEEVFKKDADLHEIEGYVEDSGEGRWVVQEAINEGVASPVMALSLMQRFSSRNRNSFSNRFLAAIRQKFGGHPVVHAEKKQHP
jgi:6-phosphogluconate dehydrogenase